MTATEIALDLVSTIAVLTATVMLARGFSKVAVWLLDSGPNRILASSSKAQNDTNAGVHPELASGFADPLVRPVQIAATLLLAWAAIVLGAIFLSLVGLLHPFTLLATMAIAGLSIQRFRPGFPRQRGPTERMDLVLFGTVSLVLVQVIAFGLLILPIDWDTLAYQLPLVDHWVRSGDLADTSTAFWYVPGNLELIGYYFSGAFSGDFWAQFANVPVIAILAAATLTLCYELEINKPTARWVCFGAVVNPVVLRQVRTLENDVAVGTLFIAATLFRARAIRSGRLGELALCGISVGLLAGVKYYAIGYAVVVAVIVISVGMHKYGARYGSRALLVFLLSFSAFTAFWYLRNFLISGTPIYPKGIALLGLSGPWDQLRPGFAKTCLALGMQQTDIPLLALAWTACGGILLTLSLLGSLVLGNSPDCFLFCEDTSRVQSPPAPRLIQHLMSCDRAANS